MDKDISGEDIAQLFNNTTCMYRGTPVYVMKCVGRILQIKFLKSGKTENIEFSFKDFTAPSHRLGMLNYRKFAVYIQRKPARMYTVGITNNNSIYQLADANNLPVDYYPFLDGLHHYNVKEMHDCLLNVYPAFAEAILLAEKHKGVFAFDKQFAVNFNREIFYKANGSSVGTIDKKKNKTDDITFIPKFEYLALLLGKNYEKGSAGYSLR